MPRYIVTADAGEWIAGARSPGPGAPIDLSEDQAEFYVRSGALRPMPNPLERGDENGNRPAKPKRRN